MRKDTHLLKGFIKGPFQGFIRGYEVAEYLPQVLSPLGRFGREILSPIWRCSKPYDDWFRIRFNGYPVNKIAVGRGGGPVRLIYDDKFGVIDKSLCQFMIKGGISFKKVQQPLRR